MIMSEWTWRVSIIYRWCARWIGNEVARKLPPLSNQASSGIMEQVLPVMKLSLSLSLYLFSVLGGERRLAAFTVGWWHSPNDIGWKARNVPVSAGLKPLHFITAQCFTALYVTRQWYSDSQASKCAAPAPNVRLGFVPERESTRQTYRHIEREREREREWEKGGGAQTTRQKNRGLLKRLAWHSSNATLFRQNTASHKSLAPFSHLVLRPVVRDSAHLTDGLFD